MNAAVRDAFEPSGGSIKDRIIRSIHALGASATKANLKKAVECNSPVLFDMQIEGMHRRGEVLITGGGFYALRGDLSDSMLEQEPKAPPAPPDPPPPASSTCSSRTRAL